MTNVRERWQAARELPPDVFARARQVAALPVQHFSCVLPVPPGINDWWEPFTVQRGHRRVASLRLTAEATRYKTRAERLLMDAGIDIVGLEDRFRDLWLQITITSYITTPLERDADGPLKPLQDLFCSFLGVDDARVRRANALLYLDPTQARVVIAIDGYALWDSAGDGGPFYAVRTRLSAAGPRSEVILLTPRNASALLSPRPIMPDSDTTPAQ